MKKITLLFTLLISAFGFSQNLVTNGNFQTGVATPWTGVAANAVDLGGANWVNQANVLAAGNPWDVNLSQQIVLVSGKTYRFTFDAFTDATTATRTIIAGLGQTGAPFASSTSNVTLTSTLQTFTYDITITYGDAVTDRVIFDMGAATGYVFIDNVSVVEVLPLIQNFEAPATYTGLTQFGGAASAVVADPASAGTNGQVLRGTQLNTGDVWQGIVFFQTTKKAKLTTNKTMTIDVYSTQTFNLLARVENGGPASATSQAYTTPGQWQTLTFDFSVFYDSPGAANGEYEKIAFHGSWNAANTGYNNPPVAVTYYLDNIRSEFTEIIQAPLTAAPTPPARPTADVVSIYSDAYTSITFDNFDAGWCGGAATTQIQIGGNNTLRKNTGVVCHGIEFMTNRLNLSSFTHIHFDFYITDSNLTGDVFNVKLVDFAGGSSEASALEVNINGGTTPQLVANQWVSVDVPITALGGVVANNLTRGNVAQMGITTAMVDRVFYDNIYFHKNTVLSSDNFTASKVKLYPNPTSNVLNIESLGTIQTISVYNVLGQEVINEALNSTSTSLDVSSLNSGIYVVKTVVDGVASSTKFIKQ
jgi:hypothetical protein